MEIYRAYNYIVVEDVSRTLNLPVISSSFVEQSDYFTLNSIATNETVNIPKSEIGDIRDDEGNIYTLESLILFLRQNTGLTISNNLPVTIHNSDDSFTLTAEAGEDVELEDITITLGDGDQVFPSNVDIDLSEYNILPMLPSGTYVPKNTIGGAFDLLWENVSVFDTGEGYISKISAVDSYETRAFVKVNHAGDFTLNFKLVRASNPIIFGIAGYLSTNPFIDVSTNGDIYKNDFAWNKNSIMYLHEKGGSIYSPATIDNSNTYTIQREGTDIKYIVNGTLFATSENAPKCMFYLCGSIYSIGSEITDIELIIP